MTFFGRSFQMEDIVCFWPDRYRFRRISAVPRCGRRRGRRAAAVEPREDGDFGQAERTRAQIAQPVDE